MGVYIACIIGGILVGFFGMGFIAGADKGNRETDAYNAGYSKGYEEGERAGRRAVTENKYL